MFKLAQFVGILVFVCNILSMQMAKRKHIIFFFVLINMFSAISFILLKSYSGCIICSFAVIQTLINNFFTKKGKSVPIFLICSYICISIVLGIRTYNNYFDILPIACSILYTINIIQFKERNIRIMSFFEIFLWIIYDFFFNGLYYCHF